MDECSSYIPHIYTRDSITGNMRRDAPRLRRIAGLGEGNEPSSSEYVAKNSGYQSKNGCMYVHPKCVPSYF
ncbi:hypothetical protein L209DRAFT_580608 [Thermothelomyces heterothallicus CBS 203.75]